MGDKLMAYVIANFSGGKDSTAMVLHMIELGEQLDEVITCDTGMEFPAMYEHIEKVRTIIEGAGIKYTTLRAEHSFEWYMFEHEVHSKKYGDHTGHGWPTPVIRWCTGWMKRDVINSYLSAIRKEREVIQCIGLAADETKRLARPNNTQVHHRHPLAEWGWTEADALAYCKARGFDWGGLYDIFKRVSCWCCPLQSIGEFRKLWQYYPELWARLEDMENRLETQGTMYKNAQFTERYSVKDLRARFEREARAQKEQTALDKFMEDA